VVIQEAGQGLLASPANWMRVLDMLPPIDDEGVPNLRAMVQEAWAKADNNPSRRWSQLKSAVKSILDGATGGPGRKRAFHLSKQTRTALERITPAIVFNFTYPRLDVHVSTKRNHLLKSPFCVHPKTGRVCVPVDVATVDSFDPAAVPTVAKLMDEGLRWTRSQGAGTADGESAEARVDMWKHTSMQPYMTRFLEDFLLPLERQISYARKDATERSAAYSAAW
jgi:DNA primase small subunit